MGYKYDQDKTKWDLLPWKQLKHVADVMTFGAKKYAKNNWQTVSEPDSRYFAAAMRHLIAWSDGERLDSESGKPHLAHAICCLLFMMWTDDKEQTNEPTG